MIETIIAAVLFASATGGVVYAEARLVHTQALRVPLVQQAISVDAERVVLEKRAVKARESLTPEDVVFLRLNGWVPETPKHKALAAGVTPAEGLGMKAIEAPKPKAARPQPETVFTGEILWGYPTFRRN